MSVGEMSKKNGKEELEFYKAEDIKEQLGKIKESIQNGTNEKYYISKLQKRQLNKVLEYLTSAEAHFDEYMEESMKTGRIIHKYGEDGRHLGVVWHIFPDWQSAEAAIEIMK